jgi:DNA gyrase subunit A
VLKNVIIEELQTIRKDFADKRRTQIVDEEAEFSLEDLIPDEEVVITVTQAGFIKRTPLATFRSQTRGGKGRYGISLRGEDFVTHVFVATTHSYIMVFTNQGKVYNVKVHEVPEAQAASRGKAIANLANFSSSEKVAGVIAVREFPEDHYVVMVSRKGVIKKTQLSEFDNLRASGLIAAGVEQDDELISAELTDGTMKIFLATHEGQAICFEESDVRSMGRQARGVRGVDLVDSDYVVSVCAVKGDEQMLSVTERGYGKQTMLSEYRVQSRGGKGVINVKVTEKTGHVVAVMPVTENDEIMIISNQGKVVRLEAADIRETGRNAQGVRVITLEEGDKVASASLVGRGQEEIEDAVNEKITTAVVSDDRESINEEERSQPPDQSS